MDRRPLDILLFVRIWEYTVYKCAIWKCVTSCKLAASKPNHISHSVSEISFSVVFCIIFLVTCIQIIAKLITKIKPNYHNYKCLFVALVC